MHFTLLIIDQSASQLNCWCGYYIKLPGTSTQIILQSIDRTKSWYDKSLSKLYGLIGQNNCWKIRLMRN